MASSTTYENNNGGSTKLLYNDTSANDYVVTLPHKTCTLADQAESVIILGTAQETTSGTFKDFTIPSGVKRVTAMLNGVSTNGTSNLIIQIGSGAISTSGYLGSASGGGATYATTAYTTGFGIYGAAISAPNTQISVSSIILIGNNTYMYGGVVSNTSVAGGSSAGAITLAGELTQIRITTVNGTDVFDAGTINISWEF